MNPSQILISLGEELKLTVEIYIPYCSKEDLWQLSRIRYINTRWNKIVEEKIERKARVGTEMKPEMHPKKQIIKALLEKSVGSANSEPHI